MLAGGAVFGWTASSAPISYSDLVARPRPHFTLLQRYGAEPDQFAELFLPEGQRPVRTIVLLHGGCWLAELPGVVLMDYLAADLQKRGYAVWNIEYRRIGETGGGYPGTFLDVARAMDLLRDIAPKYGLDLKRLLVIGHSAGGQLALWAAARSRLPRDSVLYEANALPIESAISLAGIDDLKSYRENGPAACGGPSTIDSLVGPSTATHRDVYSDTSPSQMLPIGVKQILVSGALDPIVPPQFATEYAARAKAQGDDVQSLVISGAGHFELIDSTSDAWRQIVRLVEDVEKR